MKDELQPIPSGLIARTFNNYGKGVQVGHADSFSPTVNVILSNHSGEQTSLSSTYYNLLIGYDPFERDHILVSKDRALTEHMDDSVKEKFCGWTPEKIAEIKKLPTVITCERDRTQIDEQQGVLAFITDIKVQTNGINIHFQRYFPIPMRLLQENFFELGLTSVWELNRTHWAIKDINLLEVLHDAGMQIFPQM